MRQLISILTLLIFLSCENEKVDSIEPILAKEIVDTVVQIPEQKQALDVFDTIKTFEYADKSYFDIYRFKNGKKFGLQRHFRINTSDYPHDSRMYDDSGLVWVMPTSANIDLFGKLEGLPKGIYISKEEVYVSCPFDSTQLWYEGLFRKDLSEKHTDSYPVGEHKVYYPNGRIHWNIKYDSVIQKRQKKKPLELVEYDQDGNVVQ